VSDAIRMLKLSVEAIESVHSTISFEAAKIGIHSPRSGPHSRS
jgi:hypothetical protein